MVSLGLQHDSSISNALPKTILLAEDCADSRMLILHILESTGAQVACVENGIEAVESVLEAEREHHPYDLIIMDIQMPGLTGYEATKKLRAEGIELPIIALSTRATVADEKETLQAGCNEHVSKLSGKKALVTAVEKYLSRARAEASKIALPILPIVPDMLKEDPSLIEQVLPLLSLIPGKLSALKSAMSKSDRETLMVETLGLSRFALYGYTMLAKVLQELQEDLSSPSAPIPTHHLKELLRILEEMYAGRDELAKMRQVH
jgi:CheY-like chemotaxis protein